MLAPAPATATHVTAAPFSSRSSHPRRHQYWGHRHQRPRPGCRHRIPGHHGRPPAPPLPC